MRTFGSGAIFIACFALAVFTGCSNASRPEASHGERREPPPSSSAPAAPSPPDNRPLIVAFGDSLTSGVVDKTYPDFLQQLLDQHGLGFRVENQGVAGDTTSDGLARIDNVTAEKPAVVLLEFGGNDGLRGLPVDATRQNLESMIQRLKQPGTEVLLLGITLPPNYGPEYIKPFTAMFPDLARQYRLPVLPFLLIDVYQHKDMMQPDGIHPNAAGNKVLADSVFRFLQPKLKRLQSR